MWTRGTGRGRREGDALSDLAQAPLCFLAASTEQRFAGEEVQEGVPSTFNIEHLGRTCDTWKLSKLRG